MANIVVTSTTNSIKVDFGALDSVVGLSKGVWRKEEVSFFLKQSNAFIMVKVHNDTPFAVSWDGSSDTLQIDSVGGVSPTSNSDLYDKLIALIA
jgi:hypothetical protein